MYFGTCLLMFQNNVVPPSSGSKNKLGKQEAQSRPAAFSAYFSTLKMEVLNSSEK